MNQGMCPDSAFQVIRIQDELLVYVPNTFTPDYDENNQYFYPVISTIIKPNTYKFTIFNRWEEIIYESNEVPPTPNMQPNLNNSWNGTINGQACQDGTYIWKLRFTIKESGDVYEKIGHVNLLK
jgi:gliding motility-associated-like protein